MGAHGPPDVEMGMWHGCSLHQIDRAWPGLAAENFQACAKLGVGKYNLGVYNLHRSGNGHCSGVEALVSEEPRGKLVDARLHESQE
jgi:hypothetical protein